MIKLMMFLAIFLLVISGYSVYKPLAYAHDVNPANPIIQNNWEVPWSKPGGADGIVIGNVGTGAVVKYKGTATPYDAVITDGRVPSIYVTYLGGNGLDVKDELGGASYSHLHKVTVTNGYHLDAIYFKGCLEADWPTNGCYKYVLEWWFFSDGKMNAWLQIYGPGFTGWNGHPDNRGNPFYETRWRINTGIFDTVDDGIGIWTGSWNKPTFEGSSTDGSPYTPEGYKWKVFDYLEHSSPPESFNVDPFSADSAVFWYLRQVSTETEVPGDDPISSVKGSLSTYDLNQVVQSGSGGQDNVHWYLATSFYGNCSTTVPCYPGGSWYAKDFP